MYLTRSGNELSILWSNCLVIVSPEFHVAWAVNFSPSPFFGVRNLSLFKKEKWLWMYELPRSPMTSANALFPLPLFPITATNPWLRGMLPENHRSFEGTLHQRQNELRAHDATMPEEV